MNCDANAHQYHMLVAADPKEEVASEEDFGELQVGFARQELVVFELFCHRKGTPSMQIIRYDGSLVLLSSNLVISCWRHCDKNFVP